MRQVEIVEIVVVSSACTDSTDNIVKAFSQYDSKVKLIQEAQRTGKANAINLFLDQAQENICCLISADILPSLDMIENLVLPLADKAIGMTGGRVETIANDNTFFGYYGKMLEYMLEKSNMSGAFKLGEAIAFRNIGKINPKTAVDEAYIESMITAKRYKLKYVYDASFKNAYATNWKEFSNARVRIHLGHMKLQNETGYQVVSLKYGHKVTLVSQYLWTQLKHCVWLPTIVLLEQYFMLRAYLKQIFTHENPYIWDMITTSKKLEPEEKRLEKQLSK